MDNIIFDFQSVFDKFSVEDKINFQDNMDEIFGIFNLIKLMPSAIQVNQGVINE